MPTPEQIARVRLLAEKWKEVKPESVDLDKWTCGSHACLAGHAAQMPEFTKQGFILEKEENPFKEIIARPTYNGETGTRACVDFFGSGHQLFGSAESSPYDFNHENLSDHALAAERMRMWLELHNKEIKDN